MGEELNKVSNNKQNNKRNNNKNNNQKKKSSPKNRRRQPQPIPSRNARNRAMAKPNAVPPCTLDYYTALMDPFRTNLPSVCIPDLYDTPSQKVSSKIRTLLATGTNGVGFAIVYPRVFVNTIAAKCYVSSSLYTGTTTNTNTVPGNNTLYDSQLPYPNTAPRAARTVGCGVRIRYVGTNLNLGGRIVMARLPYITSADNLSTAELLAKPNAVSVLVSRQWQELSYIPQNSSENDYSSSASFNSSPLVMIVESTAANQFELEVITHLEYTSTYLGGVEYVVTTVTPSHSDIMGMSTIRNFFAGLADSVPLRTAYQAGLIYLRRAYGNPMRNTSQPSIEYNIY